MRLPRSTVNGPHPLRNPLTRNFERVDRPGVRRPERDECPGVLPPLEQFEVEAGNDATHGVTHEDQLCIGIARLLPPACQPSVSVPRQLAGCHPIVTPPVIRKLEVILARYHPEPAHQVNAELGVAVDFPIQARKHMEVRHHPGGYHAVAEIVDFWIVAVELQPLDVVAEREHSPQRSPRSRRPHVLAVPCQN